VAKYLLKISYNTDGLKAVMKQGGSARQAAATEVIQSVGGTLESFYFAFGPTDAYVIADLPDNVTATALAATVGSSGSFSKVETVVLLTPAEIDEAIKKSVTYRPPGS